MTTENAHTATRES